MDTKIKECAYNFGYAKRGIALLIHNEEYDPNSDFNDRLGDNIDFKHMLEIFKELGFDVRPYRNLTSTDIIEKTEEVSKMKDLHKESDCFVCVIAAHGEEMVIQKDEGTKEHVIFGTNGKPVRTSEIVGMFDERNCKELADKPKFFFIQACRTGRVIGNRLDIGHDVSKVDQMVRDEIFKTTKQNSNNQIIDVECPADTLLMFASLSNNSAVRTPSTGGWLLASLYNQIKEYIKNGKLWSIEFTQVLNSTLQEMATKFYKPSDETSKWYGAFSPGCFTHTLSADVLFNKKL
ncbi:unnamed protein product [Mytilus edulis]|uniref:Caspase-3 n=1 Tax=Mytilus edulis TaxID=6550 RepID=A0A8S3REM5_MYTED|nr:unnamed protein product [Mytilus edulis]